MSSRSTKNVADRLAKLIVPVAGSNIAVPIYFWDGSALGSTDGGNAIVVSSPRALTTLLFQPNELGLTRAYVNGDIDIEGDIAASLWSLRQRVAATADQQISAKRLEVLRAAAALGALRRPPPPPKEEIRLRGKRHSRRRDALAIAHHYNVGNDFYRLVLGPTMTYSCARFPRHDSSLEQAQLNKIELVCRKLGLDRPGLRLLDVGCGWGSLAIFAAREFGAHAVGITLSQAQFEYAQAEVRRLGLRDRVEFRLQDYRDVRNETFDAISSIGMFEHVGKEQMTTYFRSLRRLLGPHGRLLNHAISKPGGREMAEKSLVNRYVFPDGRILDIANVVAAMEEAGFEVRDVESLREHYAATLKAWLSNLEGAFDEAVRLAGEPRARTWRLYMAASQNAFSAGALSVHQALGVVPDIEGNAAMPQTRQVFEPLSSGDRLV